MSSRAQTHGYVIRPVATQCSKGMAAEWQCRSKWAIHENHENHEGRLMAAGATERILRYRPWRADGGCGCWEKVRVQKRK